MSAPVPASAGPTSSTRSPATHGGDTALRVGIDIGSTTVKIAVLDASDALLHRAYARHFSKVREKACEMLEGARRHLEGHSVRLAITGSAGLGVCNASGIDFVQEVYATAAAVNRFLPQADAVVELGGEDAKIIFFGGALEERMNGSCAGGTGAFIDQMATLMDVSVEALDALSLRHEKIYPIASRCGVFAKSDIQPILNQGGRREDVAASIFQAVVDQTIAGLSQGRELAGHIVFLGGPLHFLKGLRARFVETLRLDPDHAIFPENGDCFAAIGAALRTHGLRERSFEECVRRLRESHAAASAIETAPPLFESQADYDAFCARHNAMRPPEVDSATYRGDAFLGIDAGSTTTKLVLVTPDGGILHSYYHSNLGNPVEIVRAELERLHEIVGDRVALRGAAVTGYGEDLIRSAFRCDLGLVETLAHYKAAAHFNPDVDFIIDIGGQDMKCFRIRNGAIDSILLNEACSSGCGSFIETFARALGYDIASFARLGLFTRHPVSLGSRCTVFMNSSVKQAQKDGASVEDISAGLSISIVKNAIYKVLRMASPDDIGRHIVVQGGTFHNDAVLRAFEQELGRNVVRPAIAGLMGAYGAALAARDNAGGGLSSILSAEELRTFRHTVRPSTCGGCTNRCTLTVNTFDGGRRFISGNRCSRPLGGSRESRPDLVRHKYERLRSLHGRGDGTGARGRVGLPFGLSMYENLPFWHALFTSLNFEVALSAESSRALYLSGQRTIPSDTVCYPAKLMHGHVASLIEQGVETIFYPCMSYNFDEGIGDNNYNCPVVAYYSDLLANNIPIPPTTRYLRPYFGLHRPRDFRARAVRFFAEEFGVPAEETRRAVARAYAAYAAFRRDVRETADRYIAQARRDGTPILVLAGRPYHADPEVLHGINNLVTSLGFALVTEDALSGRLGRETRAVLNQWTYHARMYNAARYVCTQPDMELVQLVSFGCGVDAITTDEVRSILESHGKLYTQIKIDDISNLGAVRIRIRSLMAAIEARRASAGRGVR